MSCNIYEKPRFNLAERRQADSSERQVCHVDIYEGADGADVCQGHAAPRKQGVPIQRPFPVSQKNRFRPALLFLVLLSCLLMLAMGILSALYIGVIQERDLSAQTPNNDALCEEDGNKVTAGNHTGWRRFHCSCYYRSEGQNSWTESQRICQSLGGNLVSIQDKSEHAFVKNLNGNRASWIGLYWAVEWSSQWKWVDGTVLSYSHWRADPVKKGNGSKAFIDMDGFWGTANTESKNWICEKNI